MAFVQWPMAVVTSSPCVWLTSSQSVTSHTWQAGDSHRAGECLTRSVQLLEPLVSSTRCDVTHKRRERAGVTSCGWGTASAARLFVRKGRWGQR